MKRSLVLLLLACVACGGARGGGSGRALPLLDLKLHVLQATEVLPCGPPVVPAPPSAAVIRRKLSTLRANDPSAYREVVSLASVPGPANLDNEWSILESARSLDLRRSGDSYSFQIAGQDGTASGTVSRSGDVSISSRSSKSFGCPICLARRVRIATPGGPVLVTAIRPGMRVWSVDRSGRRIVATVLRTRRRRAVGVLLRITLADGRSVLVSPRHPTARGVPVGQLAVGDRLSGSRVRAIAIVPYGGFTYDLLPSGPTHSYFADGVLLGSTLALRAAA